MKRAIVVENKSTKQKSTRVKHVTYIRNCKVTIINNIK